MSSTRPPGTARPRTGAAAVVVAALALTGCATKPRPTPGDSTMIAVVADQRRLLAEDSAQEVEREHS